MSDDDGDPSGSDFGGPPLPPEDRLWRHPSELQATAGPASTDAPKWIPVATAVAGAAAAVLVLVASGSFTPGATTVESGTERIALPAVATVPVVDDGAGPIGQVDAEQLVTVEGSDERSGTGLVLRTDGHIVTAATLVEDAARLQVVAHDGRRGSAAVVGSDPVTGIAVLSAEWLADGPAALLGSEDRLAIGDRITVVGADRQSAPGQVSDLSASTSTADSPMHGLIRTTAPFADGTVGGPVLDEDGHVIALALWGDPSPATWSVPISEVRRVAGDLIAEGHALHPWLGVEGDDGDGDGARLVRVAGDSPADAAGLTAGDVLLRVADKPVAGMADVVLALRGHRPGDEVSISFRRGDRTLRCTAMLTERET